jgi:hypothetical protein
MSHDVGEHSSAKRGTAINGTEAAEVLTQKDQSDEARR